MKKVQHSVRWENWLKNAIDEWGKRNGGKKFSDSVNYLLSCELSRRGYEREFYEPDVVDPIREVQRDQQELLSEGGRKKKTG